MFLTPNKTFFQLLLALLISLPGACQENGTSAKWVGLEEEIHDLMKEFHAAGLAVGVLENGNLTYVQGFGHRNVEKSLPVDENTLFGIGSVTKAFTAGVLGVLEEKGKLKLEDSPLSYIPELRFNTEEMNNGIQIHHLLSHSSGVGQMTAESSCILFVSEERDELIPRIRYWAPAAGVGETFIYNNFMYTVAGLVGERITGDTWEENVENLIFQPLGMRGSRIGYEAASKVVNFAYGYSVLEESPQRVLPELLPTRSPGGDIHSSIADMAKWVGLWLNQGRLGTQQLLSAEYVLEATSPQQFMGSESSQELGGPSYGYGWMISDFHGFKRVEHSGAISGYSSHVVMFPDQQSGIIVLSNQSNSSLPNVVARLLVDRLLKVERDSADLARIRYGRIRPITPIETKIEINRAQKPTHQLVDFVGNYTHLGFGTIVVSYENGTLLAALPFTTFRLIHMEDNTFSSAFTEDIPQVMGPWLNFTFQVNSGKLVDTLLVNLGEEPVPFSRKEN